MDNSLILPCVWAQAKRICGADGICGISRATLQEATNEGAVRVMKAGNSMQGGVVYNVADVCDWIDAHAVRRGGEDVAAHASEMVIGEGAAHA